METQVSKFRAGETVVYYDQGIRFKDKIVSINKDKTLCFECANHEIVYIHEKQVRKLRKKKRRVIWVTRSIADKDVDGHVCTDVEHQYCVRFREWPVKEK